MVTKMLLVLAVGIPTTNFCMEAITEKVNWQTITFPQVKVFTHLKEPFKVDTSNGYRIAFPTEEGGYAPETCHIDHKECTLCDPSKSIYFVSCSLKE